MNKKATIALFSVLIGVRWLIATLPGYIHPDEFFQNGEVTSAKIFGLDTLTPWEYTQEHTARSIISPFLTTGIPFWILKTWIPKDTLPSSELMFLAERLGSFLWSLVIDMTAYRLCKQVGFKNVFMPMILIATSNVTLAYYTRPLSNSFESVIFCLCLCLYVEYSKKASHKLAFFLGALFSIGVFTRITFPLYALPIGLAFIYQAFKKSTSIHQFTAAIFPLTLGIISFAVFSIAADSAYYGTLTFTVDGKPFRDIGHVVSTLFNPTSLFDIRADGDIVITPLNNLRYNLNVDNLALHGIHPRYTHFAVNLPLLFGPLIIFAALYIPNTIYKIRNDSNAHVYYVSLGSFLLGLIGLSFIPHQEARFLCPLLVPVVLLFCWNEAPTPASFWVIWILFNVMTTYIFGIIHQGGIVPTLGFLQRQTTGIQDCHVLDTGDLTCSIGRSNLTIANENTFNTTTNLVFYKTYMPPRHLLVHKKDDEYNHINVFDLASRFDEVVDVLSSKPGVILRRHQSGVPEIDFAKVDGNNSYERTIFIAPSFVPLPKIEKRRYLLMATYSPHVSFDDMDKIMEKVSETTTPEGLMALNIFLLLSDKDDTRTV